MMTPEELLEQFKARLPGHQVHLAPYGIWEATGIALITGQEGFPEPVYRCPECGGAVDGAVFEVAGEGFVGTRSVFGVACPHCGWMGRDDELPRERRWHTRTWSREEAEALVRRPLPAPAMTSREDRERRERWVREAIERHLAEVARAPAGVRNQTLARAAAAIGAIIAKVGEEVITAAEAEARLLDAAMACGLKPDEARSTIQRQMRWGLSRG